MIKLVGGLASQLHKFAIGLNICNSLDLELKVDISEYTDELYNKNKVMRYQLPDLGFNPLVADAVDIEKAKGYKSFSVLKATLCTRLPRGKYLSAKLDGAFNRLGLLTCHEANVRNSFYQNNLYKKKLLNELKSASTGYLVGEFGFGFSLLYDSRFKLNNVVSNLNLEASALEYLKLIKSSEFPISVHFRRGDYLDTGSLVLKDYYYDNCLKELGSFATKIQLFVFSDDIVYAKNYFSKYRDVYNLVFVDGNSAVDDFALMMKCKAHIIANSGFSMLAAWLSLCAEDKIYAPQHWFGEYQLNLHTLKGLPAEWNYISN